MDWLVIEKLALALGLGLLVGFQREWTAPHVAGIRTFTLITLLGAVIGLFFETLGPWLVAAGFISLTAMIVVVNVMKFSSSEIPPGLTTQVAALVMYVVGFAIAVDQISLGVLVSGGVAVLLQWKQSLHGFVERIGEKEARAIFQLVLISLVILPVLPNVGYGPYQVLNPYHIWLMVVLICGISLGSYLAYKFFGSRAGTLLGSILGGLISSTAATVSYSRRTRNAPESAGAACLVIVISSTIVFGRVMFEIAVVGPAVLPQLAPPLAAMMLLMAAISLVVFVFTRKDQQRLSLQDDPSDLKAALIFGALYAAVLFAVAAVKEHFGNQALFGVAALSGLTDMDAITLSTVQMINAGGLSVDMGWRMILVGAMSNLFFKACAVGLLGNRALLLRVITVFGVAFLGGGLLFVWWP